MVNGVFGAAGYRASLDGDDSTADGGDGQKAGLEPIDRIVEDNGKVYGAEPILREMTGREADNDSGQKGTDETDEASDEGTVDDGAPDDAASHQGTSAGNGTPAGTRVGRVGRSDLYITPELTFDLGPARPTLSPRERHNPAENEPPRIRGLIGMYHFLRPADRAADFVKQAKYMEDYESEGPFDSSFHAFSPVYSDMTVRQLKGYFAWRTRVRRGDYQLTSSSSAFVYLYELINGVGAENAEDAYNRLKEFKEKYADRYDGIITRYLDQWMRDFVIARNLDGKPRQEQFGTDIAADRVYTVLAHPGAADARQITAAILELSGAKTGRSPLNREVPAAAGEKALQAARAADGGSDDGADGEADVESDSDAGGESSSETVSEAPENLTLFDLALAAAWRALLASHAMPKPFFRSRVAVWQMTPVTLFKRAVYFDEDKADHPFETRRVRIDPVREYVRENGHWYLGWYKPVEGQKASLKSVVHEVDRLGREVWHTGRPLKPRGFLPVYSQVIADALTRVKKALDRAEWEEEHPPVRVDLSKLSAIRQAAAGTQESLLTEEEREAERESISPEPSEASEVPKAAEPSEMSESAVSHDSTEKLTTGTVPESPLLDQDELFLLRSLADGRNDWKKTLLSRHVLPSVLADSINNALFDLVGDSVLETDENGDPALVEDYRPDVTDYLRQVKGQTADAKGQTAHD